MLLSEEPFDCDGNCVNDSDGDEIDELEIEGCTLSFACNYQEEATEEDGSCVFFCPGCTDETLATTMKVPCRRMGVARTQKMKACAIATEV